MKNVLLTFASCLLCVMSAQAQAVRNTSCEAAEDVGLLGPVRSYRLEAAEVSIVGGVEVEKVVSAKEIVLGDGQEVKEVKLFDGNDSIDHVTKYIYADYDFVEAVTYDSGGNEIGRSKQAPEISALLEVEEPTIKTTAKYRQRPDCNLIQKTYYNEDDQPVFVARLTIKRRNNVPGGKRVR